MDRDGGGGVRARRGLSRVLALAAALAMTACTVAPISTASSTTAPFPARAYVDAAWSRRLAPELQRRAIPLKTLAEAVAQNLPAAGARYGSATLGGPPWTFAVTGQGVVVGRRDAVGRDLLVVAPAGGAPATVALQVGPLVSGNALRDAMASVDFDDFPDQIAFAEVGHAITERALAEVAPVARTLRPGDRVRFTGAFTLAAPGQKIEVTPLSLAREGGAA